MSGQAQSIPELLDKLINFKSEEGLAQARAFKPRPDDVLIATFAKAGTTWLQQIVHVLRTGGDMDFGEITQVVPWIETAFDMGLDLEAEQRGGIRAFKTHWGWGDVPKGCRYITVFRDPLDTAVSFYHFMDGWFLASGAVPINEFAREFFLQPYFEGGYWGHLLSWWGQRNNPDVLTLAFEDMKADHPGAVRKVAEFLGFERVGGNLEVAIQQSTFQFMKANESHFDDHVIAQMLNPRMGLPADLISTKVRAGRIGDSKEGLSTETKALFDAKWAETIGAGLGFASYDEMRAALKG